MRTVAAEGALVDTCSFANSWLRADLEFRLHAEIFREPGRRCYVAALTRVRM